MTGLERGIKSSSKHLNSLSLVTVLCESRKNKIQYCCVERGKLDCYTLNLLRGAKLVSFTALQEEQAGEVTRTCPKGIFVGCT